MLPDSDAQLLTAYVDGEVSARQRKAVMRLLRRSPEARKLLRDLQDDARALRELPRPQLAPEFADSVLHAITRSGLRPPRPSVRPQAAVPLWKVLSVAAAVLVAVGVSSYLYFSGLLAGDRSTPVARHDNKGKEKDKPGKDGLPTPPPDPDTVVKKPPEKPGPGSKDKDKSETVVRHPDKNPKPVQPDKTPVEKPADLLTAPTDGLGRIVPDRVEVSLPALFRLQRLNEESHRKDLQRELVRHEALYLEVLCRDGTQALPRAQAVLKASGIDLSLDPGTQVYQKKPGLRSHYLLFLEDVTPAELGRILEQLGQDKPAKAPGPFAVPNANLVLLQLTPDHRKKLSLYLGADPRPIPLPTGKFGVDLRKPLAEQTADQVLGKFGSRPASGKSATKGPQRQAVALAYNGVPPRAQSPEVKRFLASRKPARKGTLQVMLVLRTRV
jgi:hypothetical protein